MTTPRSQKPRTKLCFNNAKKQSKNQTTKECAEEESDGGSMNSDSEIAEEDNTMAPIIKKKQTEEPDYHTCSDGSVYHFTKGKNVAGYAVAQIKDETRDIYRHNTPCHQTWSAPDAILNYNPESTQSTDAELEGLSAAIDKYFPPYDENATTHVIDHSSFRVLFCANATFYFIIGII
jgi:hypothetical protein